ncbi:hypothetical protein O0544_08195 [Edwardsiella anguillarum]|nr:hypothetical protein [Edwardsiella anguillarum]
MKVSDEINDALRDETPLPSARLEALRTLRWRWCASAARWMMQPCRRLSPPVLSAAISSTSFYAWRKRS